MQVKSKFLTKTILNLSCIVLKIITNNKRKMKTED